MLMVIIVMPLLFNNLVVKEKGGRENGKGPLQVSSSKRGAY